MARNALGKLLQLLLMATLAGCGGGHVPLSPSAPANMSKPVPKSGLWVLESDGSPVFTRVTTEIEKRWAGPVRVVRLTGSDAHDAQLMKSFNAPGAPRLVAAIGLGAAMKAKALRGKNVVFCQAFNFEDQELVQPWLKGVSPLPPIRAQFRLWKSVDRTLTRVAMVTGPNLRWLLQEARTAAAQEKIQLVHRETNSDLEAVYVIKELLDNIDGVWLVPDNRILSRWALQEITAIGHKQGKQVVVFNSQLLSLGALLSVEATPVDVATSVVRRLKESANMEQRIPGPPVVALNTMSVHANPTVAAQLGIKLPRHLTGAGDAH